MVILCETFLDVQDAFAIVMDFLETHHPCLIEDASEYGYYIDTVEGIRYIFTTYHFENMFNEMGYDTIFVDEFIYGLEEGGDYK